MPGPTTPVLDNFGGTAGTALPTYDATNWGQFSGTGTGTNAVISTPNGACAAPSVIGTDYWKTLFGADNECYWTLTATPSASGLTAILLARVQNPTNQPTENSYDFRWSANGAGADTFTLFKTVAGVGTQLASDTSGTFDPVVNDKLWLNVTGTTITGSRYDSGAATWQQVLQVTDTDVTGAGYVGLFIIADALTQFSAFGGGTVGTVASGVPVAWIGAAG